MKRSKILWPLATVLLATVLAAGPLAGFDALLSTVQMPPGIPVATVSIGKSGAKNAAILAAQIIALADPVIEARLQAHKKEMAAQVGRKARKVENQS